MVFQAVIQQGWVQFQLFELSEFDARHVVDVLLALSTFDAAWL